MFVVKNTLYKAFCCLAFLFVFASSYAQRIAIHSHNDYHQAVPFWTAFANKAASIEVDLILRNDTLYVAHEQESISFQHTFGKLYLDRVKQAKELSPEHEQFVLLVDIKSKAEETLEHIIKASQEYVDILYSEQNPSGIKLVISGNRPSSVKYSTYPEYIFFDHQSIKDLKEIALEKVEMVSLSFENYSVWNGKGRIIEEELEGLKAVIKQVHDVGKPIRFWATPDSKSSWKALHELGVDFINTDQPYEAQKYLSTLKNRLVIAEGRSEIYTPSFENDGLHDRVDRIILLIGDGTGLAQLHAGMVANGNELNIMNLKHMGLIKTQALDDFTTDSAAGGTALATGKKANNRAIGQYNQFPKSNLTTALARMNFSNGIISTDNVTGATPAAFYAFQKERDNINGIGLDLSRSEIDLFIAGGKNDFLRYGNGALDSLLKSGFQLASSIHDISNSKESRLGYFASNHGLPSVLKGRKGFLAQATKQALTYLNSKEQPFFLMIEGAQIDTGGHQNDAQKVVEELIDFDQAVAEALKFADKYPGTLVIITADHETGGLTLPQGNIDQRQIELEFSTEDHTGVMVPIFAYGPHADLFMGVYENTEVYHKIMQVIKMYHQKP
ncbi:alkaline phosphatase [Belliella kenyensis]|uniref:Alkaline phosphatase n=1 Tax=Belliella kenyensis TaxID=1472724 RepID=A0ABV8EG34_9BACT|nr:alkaline phosphatase [Belliella kenyensis]MCH7401161.1 alkaline phosphatase [Belliella kenyensis]MDN3604158.1 alkaline phosphatase [Belliella kenyensis]